MASELAEKILKHLSEHGDGVSTLYLADIFKEDHQKIIGGVKSLQTLENVRNQFPISITSLFFSSY